MKTLKNLFLAGITALGLLTSSVSSAAIPAVIGTTITSVQTDALGVIDLVWPFVLAILGSFVLFKIVKRAINRA